MKLTQTKRLSNEKIHKQLLILLFLIAPILELLLFQYIYFGGLESALDWFSVSNIWKIAVSYSIIMSFQLLLFAVINNLYLSFTVTFIIFLTFNMINFYKMQILNEPLYPWDLLLANQLVDLLPKLTEIINLYYIAIVVIAVILLIAPFKLVPKIKLNAKPRTALFVLSVLLTVGFVMNNKGPINDLFNKLDISNPITTPKTNVTINGWTLSFILYIPDTFIEKPAAYSEEKIESIVEKLEKKSDDAKATATNQDPNIVVIMSESLFDVTNIEGLNLTADPLETIRSHQSGTVLSPQFGGGTANVEFEALTGLSNVFLPDGSSPYQQYIKQDTPSMASVLASRGYKTIALHTYVEWYWNRLIVYKMLGFHDFISQEDLSNAPIRGQYISDEVITDQIIEQVSEAKEPAFIYAITMQNHTPYEIGQYDDATIEVENDYSDETKGIIKTYANGTSYSDEEIKRLLEYFEESDEPTLVVLFGDHLPSLGTQFSVYEETGFIRSNKQEDWADAEKLNMKQTPLVIWSNYGEEPVKNIGTVSPSFLAPLIFENANLEMPLFYQFLHNFSAELPGYTKEIKVDADNNTYTETPGDYKELEETYQLLQYNLLFGKQHAADRLFE